MNIYPAIDLIDGKCVRLEKGDFNTQKTYADDPIEMAKSFADQGAKWLHLIDLDGTKDPKNRQLDVIKRIVENTDLKIQTGGGIRSKDDVQNRIDSGVSRVIIGSLAVKDMDATIDILESFRSKEICLALDVKPDEETGKYYVAVSGWQEKSKATLFSILDRYTVLGMKHLLCTDISKDGMLSGTNVDLYKKIKAKQPTLKIQASGGVSSLQDIQDLKDITDGVVIGKALYEGKFTLSEALAC